MISTISKEELKNYILNNSPLDRDIQSIISNPNFDQEIFNLVVSRVNEEDSISALIAFSRFLNSNSLGILVSKCKNNSTLFPSILVNQYLTAEIYEMILEKKPMGIDGLLLSSQFASEKTCVTILSAPNVSKETLLMIIRSKFFGSSVIDKIIEIFPQDDDVVLEMLQKGIATSTQIAQICEKCAGNINRYDKSVRYLISNYRCDKEMLKKFAMKSEDNVRFILDSGMATVEALAEIIKAVPVSSALLIINNSQASDEVLLAAIGQDYRASSNGYSNSYYDNTPVQRAILDKLGIGEPVLVALLERTTNTELRGRIQTHPSAGISTKLAVMLGKSSLSTEDLDNIFSWPGLTEAHLVEIMKKRPSLEVYRRVMNSQLASQSLYHSMIECICETQIRDYRTAITELLEKDLDEANLCYILSFLEDYNMLKQVLGHPSARLNVYKKANVLCDKLRENERNEVLGLAEQVKKRVMAELFEIEEEEDATAILRQNVEDGLSTMLWGKSGVGKTSRVFEVDPTATQLILKTGMLPEEVIGGKEPNGKPGEVYPPHWYEVLCRKCEEEPDRMHILFIDELTNVSEATKNLVWEVIGSRLVAGREEWPLPPNCAIVAAGNRPEESSAVRVDAMGGVLPAPLHNRFDSMIEIPLDIDEWQKWALETNPKTGNLRIHPIVFSFCVSHADTVMFTDFDPNEITRPFLTPRKWERLSDTIYAAERRDPRHHVSYTRIKSILGDTPICAAFIAHYEREPIDMDKITMGEYTAEDFPSLEDKLYVLGIIIAQYEGDQETIEAFILDCLGDEFLSVYNNMKNVRCSVLEKTDTAGQDTAGQNTSGGGVK